MNPVTIVPGPSISCQGTKVMTADGHPIEGVTGISLRAEVGDVWRATIEVAPVVKPVTAMARIIRQAPSYFEYWARQ